jgi:hypothetical protein
LSHTIVVAIIVPIFIDNDRDNDSDNDHGDPRRLNIICRWTTTATITVDTTYHLPRLTRRSSSAEHYLSVDDYGDDYGGRSGH